MPKVIILQGLPASGKSTWAREQIDANPGMYKRVNKDDLRSMLDNNKWSAKNEKFVLALRDRIILDALAEGKHVIVDDTNLHPKHIDHISQIAKGYHVEVRAFETGVDECIERDLKRSNSVGEKVIRGMYNQFLRKQEKYISDPRLPLTIMCDIDGTLALMNGRGPYDTEKCESDLVNPPVLSVLEHYAAAGYKIVLCSGRKSEFREHTERWLKTNSIPYDYLFMRFVGDDRNDAIVKEELFDQNIRGKFNVLFVLDDRDRVVNKWRDMGLCVFQVADGDF